MLIFVSEKNRPLLLAKGVLWINIASIYDTSCHCFNSIFVAMHIIYLNQTWYTNTRYIFEHLLPIIEKEKLRHFDEILLLAALEVVTMTTSSVASDENVVKMMRSPFQWSMFEYVTEVMRLAQVHGVTRNVYCYQVTAVIYTRLQPPNTWRSNNVVITSKRRHFDVITSKWRRFDAVITTSLLRNESGRKETKQLLYIFPKHIAIHSAYFSKWYRALIYTTA